jgi:hypothetical protein
MTSRDVARLVEFYYALATSNVRELAAYARNRKNNPYPGKVDFSGRVTCGAHPSLLARHVSEFTVRSEGAFGLETISWREPDLYEPQDAGPVKVANGRVTVVTRRITGPLSNISIWDSAAGAFKPGWGPGETPERPDCGWRAASGLANQQMLLPARTFQRKS